MEPFQQVTNEDAILNFIFDSRKSFIAATVPDQQNGSILIPNSPSPSFFLERKYSEDKKRKEKKKVRLFVND